MPRENSLYPADWLRIARKDVERVNHLLDISDPEAAGFYLQQAVEKFLKAYLLSKGWKLHRVHDLEVLLNEALTYDASFERFRVACQKITQFYISDRYPLVSHVALNEDDVRDSLHLISGLIEAIERGLASIQGIRPDEGKA